MAGLGITQAVMNYYRGKEDAQNESLAERFRQIQLENEQLRNQQLQEQTQSDIAYRKALADAASKSTETQQFTEPSQGSNEGEWGIVSGITNKDYPNENVQQPQEGLKTNTGFNSTKFLGLASQAAATSGQPQLAVQYQQLRDLGQKENYQQTAYLASQRDYAGALKAFNAMGDQQASKIEADPTNPNDPNKIKVTLADGRSSVIDLPSFGNAMGWGQKPTLVPKGTAIWQGGRMVGINPEGDKFAAVKAGILNTSKGELKPYPPEIQKTMDNLSRDPAVVQQVNARAKSIQDEAERNGNPISLEEATSQAWTEVGTQKSQDPLVALNNYENQLRRYYSPTLQYASQQQIKDVEKDIRDKVNLKAILEFPDTKYAKQLNPTYVKNLIANNSEWLAQDQAVSPGGAGGLTGVPAPGVSQQYTHQPPQQAIDDLRKNPGLADQFRQKYKIDPSQFLQNSGGIINNQQPAPMEQSTSLIGGLSRAMNEITQTRNGLNAIPGAENWRSTKEPDFSHASSSDKITVNDANAYREIANAMMYGYKPKPELLQSALKYAQIRKDANMINYITNLIGQNSQ